jgi:acetyl-CoA carboxylase biotin carboxyl carrier protein
MKELKNKFNLHFFYFLLKLLVVFIFYLKFKIVNIFYVKKLVELFKNSPDILKFSFKKKEFELKLSRSKNFNLLEENNFHYKKIKDVKDEVPKEKLNNFNNKIEKDLINKINLVKSPIVGTFYRSPSPKDNPFINIGSNVKKGDTLCIIEAMKVMNEIKSKVNGKISKILVNDKDPVEFNQVLFEII